MRNDLRNRPRKCPSETASETASEVRSCRSICLPRELPGQMIWLCGGHRVRPPPRASPSGDRDRPSSCLCVVGADPGRLCVDGGGMLVVQAEPGVPEGRRAEREHSSTGRREFKHHVRIICHKIRIPYLARLPGLAPVVVAYWTFGLKHTNEQSAERRPFNISGRFTSKECRFLARVAHLSEAPGGKGRRKAAAADDDVGGSAIPLRKGEENCCNYRKRISTFSTGLG